MKSIIYVANTQSQNVTNGGIINFGSIKRKIGCGCGLSDGNLKTDGSGYYLATMNVTVTAVGAGVLTLQAYKDDKAITGATVSINAADSLTYNLTLPDFIVKNCCCYDSGSEITLVLSGVAGTVLNAAATFEKI